MPLPLSLNEVYTYVYREERQRGVMNSVTSIEKSALVSNFGRGGRGGSVGRGRGGRFSSGGSDDRDRLKCEYCGRSRYIKDQCWDLHGKPHDLPSRPFQRGGSRGGSKFGGNRPSAHSVASSSTSELVPTTPMPNSSSDGSLSREEIEAFCRFVSNLEVTLAAPASSFTTSGTSASALSAFVPTSQSSWIIDSGAPHHMMGILSFFSTYKISSGRDKVRVVDRSYSSIAGHGDIPTTSSLLLPSALHVLNFTLNLLSIRQITKSLNCNVIFFPSHCVFQELEMKNIIGMGHEKDGLYLLDLDPQSLVATSAIRRNISITSTDELL